MLNFDKYLHMMLLLMSDIFVCFHLFSLFEFFGLKPILNRNAKQAEIELKKNTRKRRAENLLSYCMCILCIIVVCRLFRQFFFHYTHWKYSIFFLHFFLFFRLIVCAWAVGCCLISSRYHNGNDFFLLVFSIISIKSGKSLWISAAILNCSRWIIQKENGIAKNAK